MAYSKAKLKSSGDHLGICEPKSLNTKGDMRRPGVQKWETKAMDRNLWRKLDAHRVEAPLNNDKFLSLQLTVHLRDNGCRFTASFGLQAVG
jgi:hypothetical protein